MNNRDIQRKLFLEGKIPNVVIKMAIPSVIMQLITLVYNIVDTYFISQINKSAAAAVGTVFAIQAVIQAVGFGFAMGVSSICSRKLGEEKDEEANRYATSGIIGAMVVAGVISMAGLVFLNPILRLIGCTDTMLSYAKAYAAVILLFAPLACSTFVFGNIFKAEGQMKLAMYGNVIGAAVNVILDPIFIFELGWDTFGAALATSCSQLVTLILFFMQIYKKKTIIRIHTKYISKELHTYLQIITTGIPTVFRQGTQPVAGYNYGAEKYLRAKESFAFAIKLGTVMCVIFTLGLFGFSNQIMWWFCEDEEVLFYGVKSLKYASMVIPFLAFSTFVNQEYQSYGFKKQASILACCRQGICFIPIILILPRLIGVTGVEMAQPLSDFCTFLISIPFYVRMTVILKKKQENTFRVCC